MNKNNFLEDCVQWDVINWIKAIRYWDNAVDLDQNLTCLELGGNKGGLSLWLASKGNKVTCSDLTDPTPGAEPLHKKYSFSGQITYQAIDATDIPYKDHFDIVIFKSILGGISGRGNDHLNQVVIDSIYKSLKPCGKLLFAENLVASKAHQFFRKKLISWGSSWNYMKIDQIDGLFKKFDRVDFDTAGFLGAFGRSEMQRNVLGKIDTLLFDNMLDQKMKYIVFGVATKAASS